MRVDLKGVVKIKAKGRTYFYAWRGGPRLRGDPGSPEFIQSFNEAIEDRRAPDTSRFRGVVVAYKASDDYKRLADSTRESWGPALDRVAEFFGDLRIAQFDRPEKIRPIIRRWRSKWADRPRSADLHLQVLSRVCSFAVDPLGKIASNPCEGIKRLYSSERAEIIWTDADIAQIKKTCSREMAWAIDLAALTGLRRGDLLRLNWSNIGDDAITLTTGKSRNKREVIIPIYDELRDLLAAIPQRSPRVLTNTLHRPWSNRAFGTKVGQAKVKAKMNDRDLHFHDLRGTAATKFYVANLKVRVIAEILGWTEESVERIIRKYVDRQAATRKVIEQLRSAKAGT